MPAAACPQAPGVYRPVIDRNRCEGKGDCARVCPCAVFTLDVLPEAQRQGLSLRGRVKGYFHGWRQAQTANAAACQACGLCVQACPERAIRLERAVDVGA